MAYPTENADVRCWSCRRMTCVDEIMQEDGNCPHCGCEIDLELQFEAQAEAEQE